MPLVELHTFELVGEHAVFGGLDSTRTYLEAQVAENFRSVRRCAASWQAEELASSSPNGKCMRLAFSHLVSAEVGDSLLKRASSGCFATTWRVDARNPVHIRLKSSPTRQKATAAIPWANTAKRGGVWWV